MQSSFKSVHFRIRDEHCHCSAGVRALRVIRRQDDWPQGSRQGGGQAIPQ